MKKETLIIIIFAIAIVAVIYFYGINPPKSTIKENNDPNKINIKTSNILYSNNSNGYLALPDDDEKYPGLILIHEWWGLNNNIRNLAEDYAREGYVALAVDLYAGESTKDPNVARELAGFVREDMDLAFENLEGAVNYLNSHPHVEQDNLASIGWCFGGGWSYQMAKNDLGVKGSVIYYGQFNPEDDLAKMRSTIIGHFGEDDSSIKVDDVREFEATLQTLSGEHQIFIYPNSGHAFANEDNENAYVEESANVAWDRTLEFLTRELK